MKYRTKDENINALETEIERLEGELESLKKNSWPNLAIACETLRTERNEALTRISSARILLMKNIKDFPECDDYVTDDRYGQTCRETSMPILEALAESPGEKG